MTGQGEGGEVLGEEARSRLNSAIVMASYSNGYVVPTGDVEALDAVLDPVCEVAAALVAEARDTFAAADAEQRRLAEWVLANCPGEPSQDGGVVDTVIRLITSARADGAAEMEAEWEKHYNDLSERERREHETRKHFEALAYRNGLAKDAAEGELFRVREQLASRRGPS